MLSFFIHHFDLSFNCITVFFLFFLLLLVYVLGREMALTLWGVKTSGEVIEIGYGRKGAKHPVVRFAFNEDGEQYGQEIVFRSTAGSSFTVHKVGDRVPVIYFPQHPEQAEINTFWMRWFGPIFAILFVLFIYGAMAWRPSAPLF